MNEGRKDCFSESLTCELKEKGSSIFISAGNMNLSLEMDSLRRRGGTCGRLCHSLGLCNLFRGLSTRPAGSLQHHFLDIDVLSLYTGRALSPSTLYFFSLSLTFLSVSLNCCHVLCNPAWDLPL